MSDTPSPKFLGENTALPTSPDVAELDYGRELVESLKDKVEQIDLEIALT